MSALESKQNNIDFLRKVYHHTIIILECCIKSEQMKKKCIKIKLTTPYDLGENLSSILYRIPKKFKFLADKNTNEWGLCIHGIFIDKKDTYTFGKLLASVKPIPTIKIIEIKQKQFGIEYGDSTLVWSPSKTEAAEWENNYLQLLHEIMTTYKLKEESFDIKDEDECQIDCGDDLKPVWNSLIINQNSNIAILKIIIINEQNINDAMNLLIDDMSENEINNLRAIVITPDVSQISQEDAPSQMLEIERNIKIYHDEFARYCLDMVNHDIFSSFPLPTTANTSLEDMKEFEMYSTDLVKYDIYNLQIISNFIRNAPCCLLFDLFQPYFNKLLTVNTQNKLENGLLSNGINGQTLIFVDKCCLNEMGIFGNRTQNIILNAINQIYFIFNTGHDFTFDLIDKYLTNKLYKSVTQKKLQNALKSYRVNGETLMFIGCKWLQKYANITIAWTQNAILNAIDEIFNYHTFSAYISTYPLLRPYQHLFIRHKIDLKKFKNNCNFVKFYNRIGITNRYIINQFKQIFPMSFKCRTQCCDCKQVIVLGAKYESLRKTVYYKANTHALNSKYKHTKYQLIYGEYVRLFCAWCIQKSHFVFTKKCRVISCQNIDVETICFNHAQCTHCEKRGITNKCGICKLELCGNCLFDLDGFAAAKCEACIEKQERNELNNILSTAFYWEHIALIVAEYGVGVIVNCCNMACNEEIAFDNKVQYHIQKDYKQDEIYYYEPTYFSENRQTVRVNNAQIRIFCADCTTHYVHICKWCESKDIDKYCGHHPGCDKCQKSAKYASRFVKCSKCHQLFCKQCCICMEESSNECYCEECVVNNEYQSLRKSLSNIISLPESVIRVLIEFCIGYAIRCCNAEKVVIRGCNSVLDLQYEECGNLVELANMFQFKNKKDNNSDKIYYYEPQYSKPNKPTAFIDGKQLRIFCNQCTLFKLTKCKCLQNQETGNSECGNHHLCKKCGAVIWRKSVCKDCKEHFCNDCLVEYRGKRCEDCVNNKEVNEMADIIHNALRSIYMFEVFFVPNDKIYLIANTIASYGVGYIVKCGNSKTCPSNVIIFDNNSQMYAKKDYNNSQIYYYEGQYFDENRTSALINNRRLRIFCNYCTTHLVRQCCVPFCNRKDSVAVCALHPVCHKCASGVSEKNDELKCCRRCRKSFCADCCITSIDYMRMRVMCYYCESCAVEMEKNEIIDVLLNVLKNVVDEYIIGVVTDYCIGYVFKCGNNYDQCDNDIIFNNRFKFKKEHDRNDEKIYYYSINSKHVTGNKQTVNDPTEKNHKLRIFCSKCTGIRLSVCLKNAQCIHKECGMYPICDNHPKCKSCHSNSRYALSKCNICLDFFCRHCRYENSSTCKSCVTKQEINELRNIICEALKTLKYMLESYNISLLIAEYCVGFVFKCGNLKDNCDTKIIFDNKFQFHSRKDCENRAINYYEVEYLAANRPTICLPDDTKRRFRIFCNECSSNKMVLCPDCWRRVDVLPICGRHPICSNCDKKVLRSGIINCCICFESYCESCCYSLGYDENVIYCKVCLKNVGYEELYGAIYAIIRRLGLGFDINIIGIMMDYCMGFAFECGNVERKCENDIIFENMFQFGKKHDFTMQKVYYYQVKYARHNKATISMDNKLYRIFCVNCTKRIKKCRGCYQNKESGEISECCDHPICSKCNQIMFASETKCKSCFKYFCYPQCCIDIVGRCYCMQCAINKEFNDLIECVANSQLILKVNMDSEIITVLAEYSVGLIFQCCNNIQKCCNNIQKCKKKIIIDNIWQFKRKINYENKTIKYRYLSNIVKRKRNKRVKLMNNKRLVILCNGCCLEYRYINKRGALIR